MKTINNLKRLAFILPLMLVLFTGSCTNDDDPVRSFDITQLEARIKSAENLIATGKEGINAGDFQPGSKQSLQDVVNWIYKRIESSKAQEDINDAVIKIDAAIDKFLESVVTEAFPWVKHGIGSGIELSANIKQAMYKPSTIEMQVYIVDLNQFGYANNLFSTEDEPSRGLGSRYQASGRIQVQAGTAEGWPESPWSADGTMKSGEWMNVAYTNSGTEQKLYINGKLVTTLNSVPEVTDVPMYLGNSPVFNDRSCNILFKEFKVWNSVFDQGKIQSNIGKTLSGTEAGLVAYFPFSSNLGNSFSDVVGNSTAKLKGNFEWVTEPPVIILDYSKLNTAIQKINDFRATVKEGNLNGDYPVGTLVYIDELIKNAKDVLAKETRQLAIDASATSIDSAINLVKANLVAPADGVYVDSQNPSSVGLRITPNYTPQGDYTYEFKLKLKTLNLTTNPPIGDIMGNGNIGFRVNGYAELTEENVRNSGGGWNWTNVGGAYIGPEYPAGTLKSGIWQHVAIVHDNTAKTTTIYVDGVVVGQSTNIGVPAVSGWSEIWLGNSFGFKMNGSIKDFRIWDEVRTQGQLGKSINGTEPNLQVYFPLNRVKGIKFKDETGDYNGEMRGIVWNK